MIKFGIIGAGWRSEFYLRIAARLPKVFSVSGVFVRNDEKRAEFRKKYSVPLFDNLEDLLSTDLDFVVSCVSKASINETAEMLAERGVAVLTETPLSVADLGGRIQVAEQFHFLPRNMAYKKIIESGILGEVHSVQLSCCHDYHAASLIRFFLDIKDEAPHKTTVTLPDKVMKYSGRGGLCEPSLVDAEEKIIILDFGTKTALYDFNYEQYFSDIRGPRIVIRGTKGEIIDNTCTYLSDRLPQSFEIERNCSADGKGLLSLTGNGELLYENPFKGAELSDEEIAIATCLVKMKEYTETGADFYPPTEAYLDYKLLP